MPDRSDSPTSDGDERRLISNGRRIAARDVDGSSDTTQAKAPDAELFSVPAPDSFTGYKIIREIHRGGQGVVFQALQIATKRKVAIKVMKEGPFAGADDMVRFEREAQILGQLKHPNIVTIHDTGVAAGCHYFVMDYISGDPLDVYVARRPRSVRETLELFAKICDAVNAAHLRGVTHRDLKPGNIRVDADNEPHVLDFGLAKVATSERGEAAMTMTGQFVGSLPWAAPEQVEGTPARIDLRTDVYALGVVLYQVLTGKLPYQVVGNVRQVMDRIQGSEPVRPSTIRRQIDDEVETIVLKCLAKERERRYQTAADLGRDIRHYLAGEPIEAKRDSLAYVYSKRVRAALRRHWVVAGLLAIAFATVAAQFLIALPVYQWTPLNAAFERFATLSFAPIQGKSFPHVRVLAIRDETDVDALAVRERIEGVSARNNRSLRALHGRLMEHLADSGLRVLVWDIRFPSETEFDERFAVGVRTLSEAGVPVVVAVADWSLQQSGLPHVSKTILPLVQPGSIVAHTGASSVWWLEFVLKRPHEDPQPSLVLAAFAKFRQPRAAFDLALDTSRRTLDVRYWEPAPGAPQSKRWLGRTDRIELSQLQQAAADDPSFGLRRDDWIGALICPMPRQSILDAATIDYHDVFDADPGTRQAWFAGRIVVVADQRGSTDRYLHPDGRWIAGCYMHAAGIETTLALAPFRRPGFWASWLVVCGAAASGLALAWFGPARRKTALISGGAAVLLGAAVATVLFLSFAQLLVNPLVLIGAAAIAAVCGRALRLELRSDPSNQPKEIQQ